MQDLCLTWPRVPRFQSRLVPSVTLQCIDGIGHEYDPSGRSRASALALRCRRMPERLGPDFLAPDDNHQEPSMSSTRHRSTFPTELHGPLPFPVTGESPQDTPPGSSEFDRVYRRFLEYNHARIRSCSQRPLGLDERSIQRVRLW